MRRRIASMARYGRMLMVVVSTLLAAVVTTFSQTPADASARKPLPIKFAEVGAIESCEFREGIRRFMRELSNQPNNQGYIINYGSDHEVGRRERFITNEVAFRKYDRSRITLVRGGFKSKPATELWLIPPGADNPQISGGGEEPPSVSSDIGPVVVKQFSYVIEEFVLDSVRDKEEDEKEEVTEPNLAPDDEEVESSEENESSDNKAVAWNDTPRFDWVAAGIGDDLAATPRTTGVMIFYADDRRYDIVKVTSLVEEARNLLAKDARIAASRLEVKFGGYRETPEVEFWILQPRDTYPRLLPDERCHDSENSKE